MWSYQHRNFTVHQLPALRDNYIYLIEEQNSDSLIAIDPADATPVRKACTAFGKQLTHVLNTHHHWDHTDGNISLKSSFGCRIVGADIDAERIPAIDDKVAANDLLKVGELDIRVLFVPGHTRGHIAYLLEDALFCGDTLFGAGCGRLFEGSPEQMWHSLTRLAALPDETRVYCAHEYTLANLLFAEHVDPGHMGLTERVARDSKKRAEGLPTVPSTIAEEKRTNPFLWPLDSSFNAGYSEREGVVSSAPAVFTHIRARKDRF